MTDLIESMFQSFESQFAQRMQTFLYEQRMHQTNKGALRCFIISMLINIFQANKKGLSAGYLSSTPDCIFFLAVLQDSQSQAKFLDFFVFNLAAAEGRKPVLALRSKDTLVAMLIGDKLFPLLPNKKLPKAKIVSIEEDSDIYTVSKVFLNEFYNSFSFI